jgi:hypothetical protein
MLRYPKIVHPTSDIFLKLPHAVIHGDKPTPACQATDLSLKLLERLIRPANFSSFKGKAKETALIRGRHPALLFINLELELLLKKAPDAFHHPFSCTLALYQDNKIVRIANESMATHLKLLVQVIQHDIGQQRGKWAALWHTFTCTFETPIYLYPGTQIFSDQAQYPLITDTPCNPIY